MGKIKQGILGGFSGKVASVVGTSWKGIAVVKSQPLSVSNPRTAAQVAQRTKMASCVAALKPILADVIKPLNDRFAGRMSGYNYALQESIKAFNNVGTMANPENFRISRSSGKAQLIDAIAAEIRISKVSASWDPDAGGGYALASDKMFMVGINQRTGQIAYNTSAVRDDCSASVDFGEGNVEAGDNISIYLAALRADGTYGFAQVYQNWVAVAP